MKMKPALLLGFFMTRPLFSSLHVVDGRQQAHQEELSLLAGKVATKSRKVQEALELLVDCAAKSARCV